MTLMQCGCDNAGAVQGDKPVCVPHFGIKAGYDQVAESKPDLTGRKARCSDCGSEVDSSYSLPFFRMGETRDSFYNGCRGWD